MRKAALILILTVLAAAQASAVVYMKSRTYGTTANEQPNEAIEMSFEGWFEERQALIKILEGNAAVPRGLIFVESQPGEGEADDNVIITWYDPEENTCAPWDMQAMLRLAGEMMEAMGGMFDFEFGEPVVEILEQGAGPPMLGLATRYYKIRNDIRYSIKAPIVGKKSFDNNSIQELWVTDSLGPAYAGWAAPEFSTGNEEMDRAIEASRPPIEGAVLKSRTVSRVIRENGKVNESTTTMEVIELDQSASRPSEGMTVPADCQRVEMFPGGAVESEDAEAQEGGKAPWKKIKNPFKRKKKEDG